MYSNLRSVFCLQIADLDTTQWQRPQMDQSGGITYSQHITCFALGLHDTAHSGKLRTQGREVSAERRFCSQRCIEQIAPGL
jgi:hypothetical protein